MKLSEDILVLMQAFLVSITAVACAQVGTPSGGVVDEEAPIILQISPKPNATNVIGEAGGGISVTFDEYVNVKSLNSQLLVSPLLPQGLQWSMKGKTVNFVWNDELQTDRTYVFQFGDAVSDIREGNAVENFIHAFSTGDDLDTLSLSGYVVDVFTAQPKSGVRVFMYDFNVSPDSIFHGEKPKFVSTTNDEGMFCLNYLPSGRYKIMAVDDSDRNYVWTPGEGLAIFQDVVVVNGDVVLEEPLRMQSTLEQAVKYFVKSSKDSLGLVNVVLSGPINLTDQIEVGGNEFFYKNDNLWVFAQENSFDVIWSGNDTLNINEIEMIQVESLKEVKGPEGKIVSSKNAEFIFSRPIDSFVDSLFNVTKADSIKMVLDSVYIDEVDPFKIVLEGDFARGSLFELSILSGGVVGYGGVQISDTARFKWSVFDKESLGELRVKIERNGWLELISSNGLVVKKQMLKNSEDVFFKQLTQGTYQLKWTGDPDGDGTWGGVDLRKWQTPEPAKIMSSQIKIKADWSHEIEWLD